MSESVWSYCEPLSVRPGDRVAVHAAAVGDGPAGPRTVEVVRDSGDVAVVWTGQLDGVPVGTAGPEVVADGCAFPVAVTIPVDASWPSGMYLVRTRATSGGEAGAGAPDPVSAWFVVRAAQPSAPRPLVVLASNTWNAYNDFGGTNLYTGATAVSFARPLSAGMLEKPAGIGARVAEGGRAYVEYTVAHGLGAWHGMAGWAGQERIFAAWAAAAGFDVDYAINADLETDPELLNGRSVLLSVGHDEYWSWAMRDAVEGFIARGGRVAFLSGNTCYWQVRLDGARMTCFKHRFEEDSVFGTEDESRTTTMWSDPIVGRPENALTGVTFTRGGYHRIHRSVPHGAGGYEVHRPDHWLLAGTGVQRGDVLGAPHAVGYECDGCDLELRDGLPVASGRDGTPPDFEVIATAPATPFDRETTPLPLAPGGEYELEFHAQRLVGRDDAAARDSLRHGHAVLGCYAGGRVVTVGCTDWAFGLDDPRIARVTRNLLAGPTV
jgi:N,N-dimethylformamidase beta subunit-like, C-terminal